MSGLGHAELLPLDDAGAEAVLAEVLAAGPPSGLLEGTLWALAITDGAVRWARHAATGWHQAPELPPVGPAGLQELRVFGPQREVLLWRDASELRGRVLADASPLTPADEAFAVQRPGRTTATGATGVLAPLDDRHVLVGGAGPRTGGSEGFADLRDGAGLSHVLPVTGLHHEDELSLLVRHYLDQDGRTGAVRIAASRLVALGPKDA